MDNDDAPRRLRRPAIGQRARAVGRVVIDHHRTQMHRQSQQLAQQVIQVIGFVVGGNNDERIDGHERRSKEEL